MTLLFFHITHGINGVLYFATTKIYKDILRTLCLPSIQYFWCSLSNQTSALFWNELMVVPFHQVWSSSFLHTTGFAIWWLMTLNITDLDIEGNTYHGVVLNDSQEHGKQSWITIVHDISTTSLSTQTIYLFTLWGWVLIHWIPLVVWYIYSVVKMVHVFIFYMWKASSTWYGILLIWYEIAWTNESWKDLSKAIIPFSNLLFDKVKKTIYVVAKVDAVKDLKHCNIFFNILIYILFNLGWKCQRFVLNVYIWK